MAQPGKTTTTSPTRFDAIVFDLDGTLIDSAPDIQRAINEVLIEEDLAPLPLPIVTSFIGHGVGKLVEQAYRHHGVSMNTTELAERTARFSATYARHATKRTVVFPGVVDGLSILRDRGIKLGVCTNKPLALSEQILNDLRLRPFLDVVIGGDSCATRKPSPEPLWACLNSLHVDLNRSLYVGDSETDVTTARAAGVPVILVTYGYTKRPVDSLGANALVHGIDRLADAFRSMNDGHGRHEGTNR